MKKRKFNSIKLILIVLLVSLNLIGISYACWNDEIDTNSTITAGKMDVKYVQTRNKIKFDVDCIKPFYGKVGYIQNDSTFPVNIVGNPEKVITSLLGLLKISIEYPEYINSGEKGYVYIKFKIPFKETITDRRLPEDNAVESLSTIDMNNSEIYNIEKIVHSIFDCIKLTNPTYVQSNLREVGDS